MCIRDRDNDAYVANFEKSNPFTNFEEWLNAINDTYHLLNDDDTLVSVQYYANKNNPEQNPEGHPYMPDTEKSATWREVKESLISEWNNTGNFVNTAKKYGYPYGSITNEWWKIGNSDQSTAKHGVTVRFGNAPIVRFSKGSFESYGTWYGGTWNGNDVPRGNVLSVDAPPPEVYRKRDDGGPVYHGD